MGAPLFLLAFFRRKLGSNFNCGSWYSLMTFNCYIALLKASRLTKEWRRSSFILSYDSYINIFENMRNVWIYVSLNNNSVLPGYLSGGLQKYWNKVIEGATFSCNISLRINRRYIKNGKFECILCNLFTSKQVNLKFKEPITPKGCLCVFSAIKNKKISN